MQDPFDLVKVLEPSVPTLSEAQIDRHRATLLAAIRDERALIDPGKQGAISVISPSGTQHRNGWRHRASHLEGGRPRGRRRPLVVLAAAALIILIIAVALPNGRPVQDGGVHNSPGLRMKLLAAVSSPFQAVGASPGAFFLNCVTDTVCYGSSGAQGPGGKSPVVERTGNGGVSWQATAPLPIGLTGDLSCTSADSCIAAENFPSLPGSPNQTALPIAFTADGGQQWTVESLAVPAGMFEPMINLATCATPTNCIVQLRGDMGSGTGTTNSMLFTTDDSGATWAQVTSVSPVAVENLLTMKCDATGECVGVTYAGYAGKTEPLGTIRSTDFGRTWTSEPTVLVPSGGGSIWAACGDTLHCMVATPSIGLNAFVLSATSDGGTTWRVTTAPQAWGNIPLSLSCPIGADCFLSVSTTGSEAFTDPVIESTTDEGSTWLPLDLPTINGSPLGSVQPLSCPSADGCLGVGAYPQAPTSVLVSSLPSSS
jgi:hypothetical protein